MADAIKLPPLPEPDGVIAAMWNVVRHGPNYDGRQNDVIAAAKAYAERHAAAVSAAKDAEIERLMAEVAGLRAFVGNVLGTHREHGCCDIDGSDVQDWALAAGLLHEIEVSESCGAEDCACMEYYGEITPQNPAKCLRLTDTGQTALAARKGEA